LRRNLSYLLRPQKGAASGSAKRPRENAALALSLSGK
jgi:hypothetical protein